MRYHLLFYIALNFRFDNVLKINYDDLDNHFLQLI